MTLFSGPGLLVSLPGAEAASLKAAGAVFSPHAALAAGFSSALRAALDLLREAAERHGVTLHAVARPEMFGNPLARRWLRERVGEKTTQHCCLSDGTAIALPPGFSTHVFFHARDAPENPLSALATLTRRAPELAGQLAGQINSRLTLSGLTPPPSFLSATSGPGEKPRAAFRPFYLNIHSIEDSLNHIHAGGTVMPELLPASITTVQYVPLTGMALASPGFAQAVAELVQEACFDPTRLLVLRLPQGEDGLSRALSALRDASIVIPRVVPPNILFATEDLADNDPLLERCRCHIVVHDSFDFWRHASAFYARAASVTVFCDPPGTEAQRWLPEDVTEIYGPAARIRGTEPAW